MNDWIPVTDRLPDDHGLFLTATGSGTILLHLFNLDTGWSAFGKDPIYWNMVTTHWMPLPEPPENDDEKSTQSDK